MSRNLVGLLVSAAIFVGAPMLGLAASAFFLRGAFSATETADPSEKARVLAAGISESMNATVFGMVVGVLALIPTIVFAVRLHRESKQRAGAVQPPPPGG